MHPGSGKATLNKPERQLLKLLAEGKSNRAIAKALNISVEQATADRERIMTKLDLGTFKDLVRYARENEILKS